MKYWWIGISGAVILGLAWTGIRMAAPHVAPWTTETPHSKNTALLVVPEESPPDVRPLVMTGFRILEETQKYLPEYAGDRISCTNCHFSCGNTLGGEQNGISLVGVTDVYPKKQPNGKSLTLPERINYCFEKSTNGKPLPIDSEPMRAIVAYLEWISHRVKEIPKKSWLGLRPLRSNHIPDAKHGSEVYAAKCSICHGADGGGQPRPNDLSYPPLWGDHSFNSAAGMNTLGTISSFIYENMPYHEPGITVEDAIDVGAFVISQPRPHLPTVKQP